MIWFNAFKNLFQFIWQFECSISMVWGFDDSFDAFDSSDAFNVHLKSTKKPLWPLQMYGPKESTHRTCHGTATKFLEGSLP